MNRSELSKKLLHSALHLEKEVVDTINKEIEKYMDEKYESKIAYHTYEVYDYGTLTSWSLDGNIITTNFYALRIQINLFKEMGELLYAIICINPTEKEVYGFKILDKDEKYCDIQEYIIAHCFDFDKDK